MEAGDGRQRRFTACRLKGWEVQRSTMSVTTSYKPIQVSRLCIPLPGPLPPSLMRPAYRKAFFYVSLFNSDRADCVSMAHDHLISHWNLSPCSVSIVYTGYDITERKDQSWHLSCRKRHWRCRVWFRDSVTFVSSVTEGQREAEISQPAVIEGNNHRINGSLSVHLSDSPTSFCARIWWENALWRRLLTRLYSVLAPGPCQLMCVCVCVVCDWG